MTAPRTATIGASEFDFVSDLCEVVYFPRTPSVSTTELIEHIANTA